VWGEEESKHIFFVESESKRPFAETGIDGRIILRWIFKKWDG
jgi:hypothetical protein